MKRSNELEQEMGEVTLSFRPTHTPHLRTEASVLNAFLVEDNADTRNAMVEAMQEMMPILFVGVAADETSAKHWLADKNNRWDIAIIDLLLIKGTGFGVIEACRKRMAHQKVIVLTSFAEDEARKRCLELGADQVFDKAQDIQNLVDFCKVHAIYRQFMQSGGLAPADEVQPLANQKNKP